MKPPYTERYRAGMPQDRYASVTATVDHPFKDLVAEVAKVENASSSGLAFEGLTRVLEDRFTDPTFVGMVTADPEQYPLIAAQLQARSAAAEEAARKALLAEMREAAELDPAPLPVIPNHSDE